MNKECQNIHFLDIGLLHICARFAFQSAYCLFRRSSQALREVNPKYQNCLEIRKFFSFFSDFVQSCNSASFLWKILHKKFQNVYSCNFHIFRIAFQCAYWRILWSNQALRKTFQKNLFLPVDLGSNAFQSDIRRARYVT